MLKIEGNLEEKTKKFEEDMQSFKKMNNKYKNMMAISFYIAMITSIFETLAFSLFEPLFEKKEMFGPIFLFSWIGGFVFITIFYVKGTKLKNPDLPDIVLLGAICCLSKNEPRLFFDMKKNKYFLYTVSNNNNNPELYYVYCNLSNELSEKDYSIAREKEDGSIEVLLSTEASNELHKKRGAE